MSGTGYTAIEHPMIGETYHHESYGVYRYDTYPHGSVLEGRTRRRLLDSFSTLDEATRAYPGAEVSGGSGYVRTVDTPAPGGDPNDPAEWPEYE